MKILSNYNLPQRNVGFGNLSKSEKKFCKKYLEQGKKTNEEIIKQYENHPNKESEMYHECRSRGLGGVIKELQEREDYKNTLANSMEEALKDPVKAQKEIKKNRSAAAEIRELYLPYAQYLIPDPNIRCGYDRMTLL